MVRTFAAALVALGCLAAATQEARACGGFFCNAATQSPIYQAGERIVFIKEGALVTMHIEVRYSGEPSEFGWLLPLPEVPQNAQGEPLPLDQAVTISTPRLFDALDSQTLPQFNINATQADNDDCGGSGDAGFGCGQAIMVADAGSASPNGGGFFPPRPSNGVDVVDAARIGPYDAELIQAESSEALYAWLNANGYLQDPNAKPLLSHYIGLGYVFLGIRLQSGKAVGDLRPLALTFGEQAPCVPLRLTGIAATPDMPITVFVAGEGRAIPKNFIHAIVNPLALDWPQISNYVEVVRDALDTASGRAWVTEFSGGVSLPQDLAISPWTAERFREADTLEELASSLMQVVDEFPMVLDILDEEVCWRPVAVTDDGCEAIDDSNPTARLTKYAYLEARQADGEGTLQMDFERLQARLDQTVVSPLASIGPSLAGKTITRFFTMLDPEEMTRDPLFSFNPDLPPIPRLRTLDVAEFQDDACDRFQRITYPNGVERVVACGDSCAFNIAPVPGAPALEVPEVLDESGAPIQFHLDQVAEVDALLDGAKPGSPNLPAQLDVQAPAPPPKLSNAEPDMGGCAADPRAVEWLLVMALALLVARGLASRRRPT